MDVAYDHIQEEVIAPEEVVNGGQKQHRSPSNDLNTEVREVYKAFSASPWGSTLGGFLGAVRKQGEQYYEGARQELSTVSTEASKGFTDLISQTRVLSLGQAHPTASSSSANTTSDPIRAAPSNPSPEFLPADIVKEAENILSRLRNEAAVRLQLVQKAEDAADEALLKFGTNIRNFLREAVTIAPPSENDYEGRGNTSLFESKDAEGKRVVHATRFDAQLHVIHTTPSSFIQDPPSDEYEEWKRTFDVERKTVDIATDMDKFEELRRAMEKLVPEDVQYADFWTRYYFLRHVIETDEQKRRELLMGTQAEEEEVGWGDDEDEEEQAATPKTAGIQLKSDSQMGDPEIYISKESNNAEIPNDAEEPDDAEEQVDAEELVEANEPVDAKKPGDAGEPGDAKLCDDAMEPVNGKEVNSSDSLKPAEPRKSNEQSVADSDASYDILSGSNTRGPGSPKETVEKKRTIKVAEQSDEEDWE